MGEEGPPLVCVDSNGPINLNEDEQHPLNEEIRKIFKYAKLGKSKMKQS